MKRFFSLFFLFLGFLLFFLPLSHISNVHGAFAGFDSNLSVPLEHFYFPSYENDFNKIANYAVMDGGFTLQDASTTCSFSSLFPIMGNDIRLNGGQLFLFRDFKLCNTSPMLLSSGRIHGNNNSIIISENMQEISNSFTIFSSHLTLNESLFLDGPITFYGKSRINGNGNTLSLGDCARICIAEAGQLKLENIILTGIKKRNINCAFNDSSLMVRDSKLYFSQDFQFDTGSILFQRDVILSGTNTFHYTTVTGSTIDSNSTLYIDEEMTFKYAPCRANRDLLFMEDSTSRLYLNGCTLISSPVGMRLTRGTMFLENDVTFSTEGCTISGAISLGDGNVENNLFIKVLANAELSIWGQIEYENID